MQRKTKSFFVAYDLPQGKKICIVEAKDQESARQKVLDNYVNRLNNEDFNRLRNSLGLA